MSWFGSVMTMLKMADDYYSDAKYFRDREITFERLGNKLRSRLIDAGVKIGLLDGHGDDVLFLSRNMFSE